MSVVVLRRASDRRRALLETIRSQGGVATPLEAFLDIWDAVAKPENLPLFRLFFDVDGIALQDRERFPDVSPATFERSLDFTGRRLSARARRNGIHASSDRAARPVRGFLLGRCATGDYDRIERAL